MKNKKHPLSPAESKNQFPVSKTRDLVIKNLENELLIYNLETNRAVSLNNTSKLVWEMCDGENSVSVIAETLSKKLKKAVNEELIWLAIDQLNKEKLLENQDELIIKFDGLSRRAMIKKAGLASAVGLPVIYSIVAPTAANAQSSSFLAVGATCASNNQCASNNCSSSRCCANSTGGTQPGQFIGVGGGGPVCVSNPADCAGYASRCCSNSASAQYNVLCYLVDSCVCDPYP